MEFTKPPLPFIGNKSKIRKELLEILNQIDNKNDTIVFVDLFGGSLFISHLLHTLFPKCKIITNDYDNYVDRLNHIHETNMILQKLKDEINIKINEKIPDDKREFVRETLSKAEYLDWNTLSAKLL